MRVHYSSVHDQKSQIFIAWHRELNKKFLRIFPFALLWPISKQKQRLNCMFDMFLIIPVSPSIVLGPLVFSEPQNSSNISS